MMPPSSVTSPSGPDDPRDSFPAIHNACGGGSGGGSGGDTLLLPNQTGRTSFSRSFSRPSHSSRRSSRTHSFTETPRSDFMPSLATA